VQQREELLDPFQAGRDARRQGMVDLVRGNDLLDAVQSVLTDDLAPTAEQGLVVFGGHAQVPFCGLLHSGRTPALAAPREDRAGLQVPDATGTTLWQAL
jgi:hypothetical protein